VDYHEFPERYPHWLRDLDSPRMIRLAEAITRQLAVAMREPVEKRHMVPGLREALRVMAVQEGVHLTA
jgi:hypothetical protein